MIDSVLKTNPWTYTMKDVNRETIIGSFYEKELLLSKLYMSYYIEPEINIRDKVKVVLDRSRYTTKKNQRTLQVLIYLIQLVKVTLFL